MLRGVSAEAPVLLFLEGGPGGTGIGRIRNSGEDLEQNFVVATWDQRGTGKSYDALEPTSTLTVEQMVEDTIEVTDYLRDRFDKQKIYLVGSSWGTIIGTMAVQRSPEQFHAYVGTGQMVDPFETDKLMYAESHHGRRRPAVMTIGRQDLRELGPPPYDDTLDYPVAIASNPKWIHFEHGDDYSAASEYPASLFVREYSLVEQLRGMAAIAETFNVLYPQLSDTDFRVDVPRLDVPVYLVEGGTKPPAARRLAREWFDLLSAPTRSRSSSRTRDTPRRTTNPATSPGSWTTCSSPPARQQRDLHISAVGTFSSTPFQTARTRFASTASRRRPIARSGPARLRGAAAGVALGRVRCRRSLPPARGF